MTIGTPQPHRGGYLLVEIVIAVCVLIIVGVLFAMWKLS